MDPKYLFFSSSHLVLSYGKVLHHARKGIVRHQTVPGWLGEVAFGEYVGTILYSKTRTFLSDPKLLKDGLVSRRAAKKPLLSREKHQGQTDILQKVQGLDC